MKLYKVQRDATGQSIMIYTKGHKNKAVISDSELVATLSTVLRLEPLSKVYVEGCLDELNQFIVDPSTAIRNEIEFPDW